MERSFIQAVGLNVSVAQADDAVGVFKQPRIVRGKDEREAKTLIQSMHQVDELGGVMRIKICSGLVSQH